MPEKLKITDPLQLNESIFKLIGKDWMLITAGTKDKYNMMTASWGSCGVLWNKTVAVIYVRPQRFTYEFLEEHTFFTLNFFDEPYRGMLNTLGTKSGREMDKMSIKGLTVFETPNNSVGFEQAKMMLECKKIYGDFIKPDLFLDDSIHAMYAEKDYHKFYIGEIRNAYRLAAV